MMCAKAVEGGVAEAGVGCGVAAVAAAADHVPDDGGDRVEGTGGQGAVGGDVADVDLLGEGVSEEKESGCASIRWDTLAWLNVRLILRIEGVCKEGVESTAFVASDDSTDL